MTHRRFLPTVLSALLIVVGDVGAESGSGPVSGLVDGRWLAVVDGNVQVEFDYIGDVAGVSFRLQYSGDLDRWNDLVGMVIVPDGGVEKRYLATGPEPAGLESRGFYRVLIQDSSATSEDDLDGDGLSNSFETNVLGTRPDLADTDGDGTRDGFEFTVGTDPHDPLDCPVDIRDLPMVEFVSTFSATAEGSGPHVIELKSTPAFSGTVHYEVSSRSSAVAGVDFVALSGSTTLTGGSGQISLQAIDDLSVDEQKLLLLDLLPDASGRDYRAAGATTHVARLEDNDSYWSGVLRGSDPNSIERSFRVCISKDASNTEIVFTSGNSDGLVDLDGGLSSQSTGLIPRFDATGAAKEIWPSVDASRSFVVGSAFATDLVGLPVDAGGGSAQLVRSLSLRSDDSIDGEVVRNGLIVGNFTETLRHASDPKISYLDRDRSGVFVLARDVAKSPDVDSPLDPTD